MHIKKIVCLLWIELFLFCGVACQDTTGLIPQDENKPTNQKNYESEKIEPTVLSIDAIVSEDYIVAETITPVPTPNPTEIPTLTSSPVPTKEPTASPVPTRSPFSIEGDITENFPDYDTGLDADYSYQSDEMRIAIKKYVNPHDPDIHETYYVADIWIKNVYYFRTGFGRGNFNIGREDGEAFATREHAIFAVNGSMNKGLVIHNGVQYKKLENTKDHIHPGVCILYKDGSIKVFNLKTEKFNFQKEYKKGIIHAWQFGPALIENGEIVENFSLRGTRHPRIIVGYYEPGHYVVVAVDGRNQKRAIGMNEYEMAQLMKELGCQEAMNFDGGTSAIMTFMGKCISNPSGVDTDGDGKAGRELGDMLLFAEYDSEGNAPSLQEVDVNRIRYSNSK